MEEEPEVDLEVAELQVVEEEEQEQGQEELQVLQRELLGRR